MNRIKVSLSAIAFATTFLSTISLVELPDVSASTEELSSQKKVAFQVFGLMKTKSGAT